MRILAATDFSTRSQRALRRAGLLARDTGAELTLVHVVDDDQPQDLIAMERREAGRILAEQVGAVAEFRGVQCHPMVATGDPFDAILRCRYAGCRVYRNTNKDQILGMYRQLVDPA
jgi:universal stress protein E